MKRGTPYTDGGVPIRAKPGRPPKPALTDDELRAIDGLGDMQAAAKVSELRGANLGSISQADANRRRVSHDWVRRQRLRKMQPTQNAPAAPDKHATQNGFRVSDSGPRTIRDPSTGVEPAHGGGV